MAAPKPRKLKVFQAQFGFHDSVVAASSQAAALKAWGTRQNLFAEGRAQVATDESAVAAALAHPDRPLRRAVGSDAPFALEPTGLPRVPDAPKIDAPPPPSRKPERPAMRPPDRSGLDAAEGALLNLDRGRKAEEQALAERQRDLDAAVVAARDRYVTERKAAKATIAVAREAYRKAGGRD